MKAFAAFLATAAYAAKVRTHDGYEDAWANDDLGLYTGYDDHNNDYGHGDAYVAPPSNANPHGYHQDIDEYADNYYYGNDYAHEDDYYMQETNDYHMGHNNHGQGHGHHDDVHHDDGHHNDGHHNDGHHDDDHHYESESSHHTTTHYESSSHHTSYESHDSEHYHDDDDHYYEPYEPMHYTPSDHDNDYAGEVPSPDFWGQVDDYNPWNVDLTQEDYEDRLHQEAQMMVALEAIREALVELDYDIDALEDCIEENNHDISDNEHGISDNDHGISENDHEIEKQQYRIKRL
jgi:hypothetical protein